MTNFTVPLPARSVAVWSGLTVVYASIQASIHPTSLQMVALEMMVGAQLKPRVPEGSTCHDSATMPQGHHEPCPVHTTPHLCAGPLQAAGDVGSVFEVGASLGVKWRGGQRTPTQLRLQERPCSSPVRGSLWLAAILPK